MNVRRAPSESWQPVHPAQAARWFATLSAPWWIAGGWALDLFLGEQNRPHGDLDVGVRRCDLVQVLATLDSWDVVESQGGALEPLRNGSLPRASVNSLWCRPPGAPRWMLELLLDQSDGDDWVFRRHPDIRRPLAGAIRRSLSGLPILAPEIQLLYKARNARASDQSDFERVAPRLDPAARDWLHHALLRSEPHHAWISMTR